MPVVFKMFKKIKLQSPQKRALLSLLGVVLFLVFFRGMGLYVTMPATEDNTYSVDVKVEDVEAYLPTVPGRSYLATKKLKIYTDSESYTLDIGVRNEPYNGKEIALGVKNDLLSRQGEFEFIVWEHFVLDPFFPREKLFWVKQVVGIKQGSDVIWDIEQHNEYHRIWREDVVISRISCISLLFIACCLIYGKRFVEAIKRRYRRYKKKQKKKNREEKML